MRQREGAVTPRRDPHVLRMTVPPPRRRRRERASASPAKMCALAHLRRPRRRLNQFPELAQFVRDDGQADRYAKVRINYVDHHNPDLILFDDKENELNRIDLTRLRTSESMHKLMVLLGLREICRNANPSCADWAAQGECERNAAFMSASCRKSCS
eukprot:6735010-Prymnesium_polylepis.1